MTVSFFYAIRRGCHPELAKSLGLIHFLNSFFWEMIWFVHFPKKLKNEILSETPN